MSHATSRPDPDAGPHASTGAGATRAEMHDRSRTSDSGGSGAASPAPRAADSEEQGGARDAVGWGVAVMGALTMLALAAYVGFLILTVAGWGGDVPGF